MYLKYLYEELNPSSVKDKYETNDIRGRCFDHWATPQIYNSFMRILSPKMHYHYVLKGTYVVIWGIIIS